MKPLDWAAEVRTRRLWAHGAAPGPRASATAWHLLSLLSIQLWWGRTSVASARSGLGWMRTGDGGEHSLSISLRFSLFEVRCHPLPYLANPVILHRPLLPFPPASQSAIQCKHACLSLHHPLSFSSFLAILETNEKQPRRTVPFLAVPDAPRRGTRRFVSPSTIRYPVALGLDHRGPFPLSR